MPDTDFRTPAKRRALQPRSSHYTAIISRGRHLAYRKRSETAPGKWSLRIASQSGGYDYEALGDADDLSPADGVRVLSHSQALAMAINGTAIEREARSITVEEVLTWHGDNCKATSSKIRRGHQSSARRLAKHFPNLKLADLTFDHLKRWLATRRGEVAVSSVNYEMMWLRSALGRYCDSHNLMDDPRQRCWNRLRKLPTDQATVPPSKMLTQDQFEAIKAECTPALAILFEMLWLTGCRPHEVQRAKVKDFHPLTSTLTVRGKGRLRVVHLGKRAAAIAESLATGRGKEEFLFLKDDGSRWLDGHHSDPFRKAVKRAGLPGVTIYQARHSFISHRLMSGVPIAMLAKHVGNSPDVITQHYTHFLSPDAGNTALARLIEAG